VRANAIEWRLRVDVSVSGLYRAVERQELENEMAKKPRDYDAELKALMDKAKKLKSAKTVQLGELVQVTGADALPVEALAGALLAAMETVKKQPDAVTRWTERGQALFQNGGGGKRSKADSASKLAELATHGA
jgi:hypothetical protein